jgi:hypothetical protein
MLSHGNGRDRGEPKDRRNNNRYDFGILGVIV